MFRGPVVNHLKKNELLLHTFIVSSVATRFKCLWRCSGRSEFYVLKCFHI
jgi:hypothetical protein